jgi:hypothetical protein
VFIRIIATPPGEPPEEVRRAWVGLELPLAAGETGPRTVPTGSVLSGPRTFVGTLLAQLTGRSRQERGYVIDARQALALLAAKAPWAAQWWRERAPHCWQAGRRFLFAAQVCVEVGDGPTDEPPARARSEAIFAAGPRPTVPSSEQIQYRPAPKNDAGRGLALVEAPVPHWKWLVGAALATYLLYGVSLFADLLTGFPSRGIGPFFFAFAAIPWAAVYARWALRKSEQQTEPRRQQPALFLLHAAIFCAVGIFLLLAPLAGAPESARMRFQQWLAPVPLFFGAVPAFFALGYWRKRDRPDQASLPLLPDPGLKKAICAALGFFQGLPQRLEALLEGRGPRRRRNVNADTRQPARRQPI